MSSATDLDAFLTQLESKLRAPFASLLDIGPSKKNEEDYATYLAQLGAVLPRAEKVTQLRALIGLLASSPQQEDAAVKEIVTAAQEAPVYEEWVRVIASIVEEMLFSDDKDNTDSEEEEERKRENNLRKTCMEILDRLRKLETKDDDDDADPLLVPYRYHLVPPSLLQSVLPETSAHTHFSVHAAADILHMDALPAKAEPAAERPPNGGGGGGIPPPSATATAASSAARPGATTPPRKPAVVRPKSSMFLPSTKPRTLTTTAKPTGLHQRKAALSLVLQGRRAGRRTVPPGRAVPDARGKASKMKLLDVTEVQDLEQQQSKAKVEPTDVARGRQSTVLLAGKKRPLPETRPVEPANAAATEEPPAPTETPAAAGDLATAALLAYQQQAAQPRRDSKKQQDWRQLLQERSNRLSDDDRRRIQQFFVDRVNPTPGTTKYKMKVHEERTTDAATGRALKETYYLELDYTNFTSTQTKKVKRYGDDA